MSGGKDACFWMRSEMTGNYDTPTWAQRTVYYSYKKKKKKAKTKDFFEHQQKKLLYNIWVKTIKYMINTVNGLNPEGCKFMVAFV